MELSLLPLGHHHHPQLLLNSPLHNRTITQKGVLSRKRHLLSLACRCANDPSSSWTEAEPSIQGRRSFSGFLLAAVSAAGLDSCDIAEAVSTSRRALRGSKIPESDFTTLPNGLKYYDLKVGGGAQAVKGSRVAVHYVAKWKNITFMTSRQGIGVTGGSPYGFDVGQSEKGSVLKGLDLGVQGMRVGGQVGVDLIICIQQAEQRLLIVPPG
ncbi:peptidyl-prolyl cis-trans isomerase FKBP16-4, chloroplastic-like isoform X1 [Iris pallida]|uniref:peptidylprolyl isomerase n=1 Tax=Iris pallida TaxID=29817 RepID=A0AAX6EAI0_IRIPA|nr:peptidyl-prolyl cis-trans isomerase FKBP16-4, chloroplastic-like isoform X1 [Iris pallida]